MTFKLFNLNTGKVSKRTWKTYEGALKNVKEFDVISTPEGIKWMKEHPNWIKDWINKVPHFVDVIHVKV